MFLFYMMAMIPVIIAAILWVISKKIVWYECLLCAGLSFATAGIIHTSVIYGMTADTETWSGQITHATHYPEWIEEYQEAVYKNVTRTRTVGYGKNSRTETYTDRVFSHYETRHRTHRKYWEAYINYGKSRDSATIDQNFFQIITEKFGGKIDKTKPHKSGFDSGDPFVYTTKNETGYIFPTTTTKTFENRIKAAPSVFSFVKVPEGTPVYQYPKSKNWMKSGRVMGIARNSISTEEWDRMCSRLGPPKKVNVIIAGFGNVDSGIAQLQEAKWIGGKKNDLVLCFGGGENKWTYVFGWTEQEIVKRNLETILLKNTIDDTLIPKIEEEILKNYIIKDWDKFSYISVEPPTWSYWLMLGVLIVTQSCAFAWSFLNQNDKDSQDRTKNRYQFGFSRRR